MARQVAHEIKNPLTPIQLSASLLPRPRGAVAGVRGDPRAHDGRDRSAGAEHAGHREGLLPLRRRAPRPGARGRGGGPSGGLRSQRGVGGDRGHRSRPGAPGPGRASRDRRGRPRRAPTSPRESREQRHRGDGGRAPSVERRGGGGAGRDHRDRHGQGDPRRGSRTPLRTVLHDAIVGDRARARDRPADHRGPRRRGVARECPRGRGRRGGGAHLPAAGPACGGDAGLEAALRPPRISGSPRSRSRARCAC